jgi:hypothetical protein
MHLPPLDGQPILRPRLLKMNQRTLPLTKQQMLQGGDGEELGIGEHVRNPHLIAFRE